MSPLGRSKEKLSLSGIPLNASTIVVVFCVLLSFVPIFRLLPVHEIDPTSLVTRQNSVFPNSTYASLIQNSTVVGSFSIFTERLTSIAFHSSCQRISLVLFSIALSAVIVSVRSSASTAYVCASPLASTLNLAESLLVNVNCGKLSFGSLSTVT